MGVSTRANDITVKAFLNGAQQGPYSGNSGSLARGLGTDEFAVTGEAIPRVESVPGPKVLTLDLNDYPWIQDLMDIQEQKALGNIDFLDFIIEVSFALDYGLRGNRRYKMPDCVLSDGTTTFAGGTERVTDSLTLTYAGTLQRLS